MKKIAIINSVYKVGSTGRICFELSQFLERSFETITFYGRNNNKSPHSYCFAKRIDIIFHGIFSRIFDMHGLYSKHSTKKLCKKLNKFSPDLIVVNNLHGYYLNYPYFLNYIQKKGIPIVCVFHDCWNFTGHCAHFSYNKCEKWKTECSNCEFLNNYPKSILFDKSNKNFKCKKKIFSSISKMYIVTPSKWLYDLVDFSFLKNKPRFLINNGIDLALFRRHENPTFRKKFNLLKEKIILCVAYIFDERKGIDDILKLSNLLSDNEKIVVVGRIKGHLKLPSNILHIEQTNNVGELIDIYSSCDVFFNPTYEDNYPTVNMEALACGLPVICYKTGGATETIDQKFAIDQGNVAEAYKLFKKLVKNDLTYNFGNIDKFSKDITYSKYRDLIENILGKQN